MSAAAQSASGQLDVLHNLVGDVAVIGIAGRGVVCLRWLISALLQCEADARSQHVFWIVVITLMRRCRGNRRGGRAVLFREVV